MRCAVTRAERVVRAVVSVIVGSFALSTLDNLWCAIPAGVCSILLMVGAITGWCPTNLLSSPPRNKPTTATGNDFGIPEATQHLRSR